MAKTLCNLSNKIVAVCDGAYWEYKEQKEHCDGATLKHSRTDKCIHLCDDERCDSHVAQDLAVEAHK